MPFDIINTHLGFPFKKVETGKEEKFSLAGAAKKESKPKKKTKTE